MYSLYLDTKLTKETRKSILESGFSRIPICYSEQYKFVVGILLTRKLISVEPSNQTIAELFVQKLIPIKVPLYVHKSANLKAISSAFKEGRSHMAIVCKDVDGPGRLRNMADSLQLEMQQMYRGLNSSSNFDERQLVTLSQI
jgi:CBS domain containing-hemolysin-like protein